jgi:heme oxygenase (biliverdin-IX-beta and delta-forming)
MDATDSLPANKHLTEDRIAGGAIVRLRQETGAAHRELDETLDLVERLSAGDQRIGLLAGYHRLHGQTEARVAPALRGIADLDFSARRRSSLIAEGIRILGHSVVADSTAGAGILTRAEALGAFYVIEGSSLGGRVILKELKRRDISLAGLGFLDPYGADTSQRWQSFLAILEREIKSSEQKADAVKGALDTFAFAKLCLCKESTN